MRHSGLHSFLPPQGLGKTVFLLPGFLPPGQTLPTPLFPTWAGTGADTSAPGGLGRTGGGGSLHRQLSLPPLAAHNTCAASPAPALPGTPALRILLSLLPSFLSLAFPFVVVPLLWRQGGDRHGGHGISCLCPAQTGSGTPDRTKSRQDGAGNRIIMA